MARRVASAERFMGKYVPEPNSGCWLWTDALDVAGYGDFYDGGIKQKAHRKAYELFVGPIPAGLTLDHLCRVRCCVNPDHLEAVTLRENILRGEGPTAKQARRTHCLRHPDVLLERLHGEGQRRCLICWRQSDTVSKRHRPRSARKTHCYNGHEYTTENTIYYPNEKRRRCRACTRLYSQRSYARRRSINNSQELKPE